MKPLLRHSFSIHVVAVGIVAVVLCICTIIFGLGLLVTVVQIGVRIACTNIFELHVVGESTQDVCIG